MNCFVATGFIAIKPVIRLERAKKRKYMDFNLVEASSDILHKRLFVCKAYDEVCEYIWRNCSRGTLLEISGYVECKQEEEEGIYTNYVVVEKATALTKRQIVIERFNEYINKYSSSLVKNKVKSVAKKKEIVKDEQPINSSTQ